MYVEEFFFAAAKDSVGDKFDQKSHDTKAEVHKESAKN